MQTDSTNAKDCLTALEQRLFEALTSGVLAHLALTKREETTEDMRAMSLEVATLLGEATNNVHMLYKALEKNTDNA